MSERQLLDVLAAIYAALNQKVTFPADVAYAKQLAYNAIMGAIVADATKRTGIN